MSDVEPLVWMPDELVVLREDVGICRCGHPEEDHRRVEGCQAAKSYRPESLGGGVGSSICRCEEPVVVARVPRKYIGRFRQSPVVKHSLARGVESMGKAGALGEMDWEIEQIVCELMSSGDCVQGAVTPAYRDKEGRATSFFCALHLERMVGMETAFLKLPRRRSIKAKQERREAFIESMNEDPDFRRSRGLE